MPKPTSAMANSKSSHPKVVSWAVGAASRLRTSRRDYRPADGSLALSSMSAAPMSAATSTMESPTTAAVRSTAAPRFTATSARAPA
jgi:hypothetical protein